MQTRSAVLFFGLFCAAIGFVAARQFSAPPAEAKAEEPNVFGKANDKKLDAYIVLLRLRHDLYLKWKDTGKWPDDKDANAALAAHGEYWQKQLKAGRAIMAGGMKGDYWDNVAQIVFEADSEENAKEIVKNDPAVKEYVFQAQVRPYDVLWITNKFHEKK